jgi:mannose-P-dolichol utilization defect protein 1
VSLAHISHAYDLNNIILMSSKLPQILQNLQARSTGQLSVITYAANTLGCVARLFTTAQEGGGAAMFRQYVISE